jgi:hypothetical protein
VFAYYITRGKRLCLLFAAIKMAAPKGQIKRSGCGCFAAIYDFHPRCASHWKAGDCAHYNEDFELEGVKCDVCRVWSTENWLSFRKNRQASVKRKADLATQQSIPAAHSVLSKPTSKKAPMVNPKLKPPPPVKPKSAVSTSASFTVSSLNPIPVATESGVPDATTQDVSPAQLALMWERSRNSNRDGNFRGAGKCPVNITGGAAFDVGCGPD